MKVQSVCVNKVIGTGILAACILAAGIYGTIHVSYNMGYSNGMNKILEEQEVASQEPHTDWADFGGGYYIIGAEAIAVENGTTTFEFISGTQVISKLGEFNLDSVYMLTVFDEHTPEYMNDDTIVVIWEAK